MGLFDKKKNNTEKQEKQTEKTNQKSYQPLGACIVTKSLLSGTSRLKWMFRENNGIGTGWVALGDTDTQEYINQVENLTVVDFSLLMEIEPAVRNVFYMPIGADLEFISDGKYFVDTRTGEEIREPVKHPLQIAFERNLKFLNQETYDAVFFQNLFRKTEKLERVAVGQVDLPTGRVVLADPMAYLGNEKYQTVLEKQIPKGSYDAELSIMRSALAGIRVAAARLKITDEIPLRYEIAMPKGFEPTDLQKPGVFSFFGVDTGLACFADVSTAKEYKVFLEEWKQEHPEENLYQDYFSYLFAENAKSDLAVKVGAGNFLLWKLPQSGKRLVMFASGMGDGIYSAYWGMDQNENITELVIPFMNLEYF